MQYGASYSRTDMNVMKYYTLDHRVNDSVKCIDQFLDNNKDYLNCFIIGISEGSIICAKVYNNLKNKDRINKIVLCSAGGLSQLECFKIQYDSYDPPYKKLLQDIDAAVNDIKLNPDSLTKMYLGWPYRRWSGFMFYKPIDDIIKVEIPVLVMHGDKDLNAPVESSRFIKEEFDKAGKTNLTYKEYKDKDHGYNHDFKFLVKEIEDWL